jgi:hypothetical protein
MGDSTRQAENMTFFLPLSCGKRSAAGITSHFLFYFLGDGTRQREHEVLRTL